MNLAYCDYIGALINTSLLQDSTSPQGYITSTDGVKMDLHPIGGYFVSTKKTIDCSDMNGKKYRITVEEIDE